MKTLLAIIALSVLSSVSFAGELDGNMYCRVIESNGMFGQPVGKRQHCVSFENSQMTDNASTFFGNPPMPVGYVVRGNSILVENNRWMVLAYTVSADRMSIENDVGAVLTLVD